MFLSIGMLKQKYFLTDIFILSAEKQPIKLSWRKIEWLLTFYSGRHSYASALYHANVPMGLIAQNMGRNPAEIETYLKEFDNENIYDANLKLYLSEQPEYKDIIEKSRDEARKKLKEEGKLGRLKLLEDIWEGYDEEPFI